MKYKLELEEEYDFEGWAFLHFHTAAPGYAFVDSLNRLYDLALERLDDMVLDGVAWPLYRFLDSQRHCLYLLVERPMAASGPWEPGDKVLVVGCENADATVQRLYADMVGNATVDEADLVAREHADMLADLLADFTVANVLDFSAPAPTRKAAKERQLVQRYCDALLAYVEQKHLDLSQTDRMRMEMLH